jgi:queuine tRNA-ribosyltransferase
MTGAFAFELTSNPDGPVSPRAGLVTTARGSFPTPAFMPVGTLANVKTLLPEEVRATGAGIMLVNAYHLYLRPGHELVAKMGGVHQFMGWDGPVLSDSGGFQVFSLSNLRKVSEEGVRFRSHIDGSEHHYTPELAMEVQAALGVDIAMPLDQVLPGESGYEPARDAVERTLRWFERCRAAQPGLTTFAIVQGGTHEELRRFHAREASAAGAPGYSIGGLSVGETKDEMWSTTAVVNEVLPVAKPRYLMGVGSPEDLVNAVGLGVDMFDCVLPTRLGRNGALFTDSGRVNIRNSRFREDPGSVERGCDCVMCGRFSMAYVHHLFRNDELLGYRLATLHNIRYLVRLCGRMRKAIADGSFSEFAEEYLGRYLPVDERVRREQKARYQSRSQT